MSDTCVNCGADIYIAHVRMEGVVYQHCRTPSECPDPEPEPLNDPMEDTHDET